MNKLKKYKLNELYEINSGISTKPEQYGVGSPFLSFRTIFNNYFIPEEINEFMNTNEIEQETYSVKKGDVFLTRTSETLDELAMSCVALKDYPKTTFSGFAKRLRPIQNDITYDKFMGFFLRSKYFRKIIDNNAIMTLRASFNEKIFSYLNIELPEYKEQVKIGDLLHLFEEKIKINNKINSELEDFAKKLYEYWFIQFDFPDENERPYKSSGGKMIYNEKLKREIPIDWEVKQIGNIIQEQEKSSVQVNQADNTGKYPFFTSGNEILKYNIYFVDDICCYLSTGGNACVKYYYGKASYSTDTWCISANEYTFYLYNYLVSINNQMDKLYFAGTGLKHLQKDIFKNSYIVIPPYDYIEKYNNIVSNGYKMSSKNYLQNQELAVIRDYLLPLLMNGQICII